MRVALPMYVLPEVKPLMAEFWDKLRGFLLAQGWDTPLEEIPFFDVPWESPESEAGLLFTHACGYPYMKSLKARGYRYLATPTYSFEGCGKATHSSILITHQDSAVTQIEKLRGFTAAINSWDSNTGMNLLRHTVAPFAEKGKFFRHVLVTGSHSESIHAVAEGKADIAAIDAVTCGYIQRFQPKKLSELNVLGFTASTPALPLLAAPSVTASQVNLLQHLLPLFGKKESDWLYASLNITSIEVLPQSAYQRILEVEEEAAQLGYYSLA